MLNIVVCCDLCSKPLEIVQKHFLGKTVEAVRTFKTKEWDTTHIYPFLCEECANEIDEYILKLRNGVTK